MKSSQAMILALMNTILAIAQKSLENSGLQRGLTPWLYYAGATL